MVKVQRLQKLRKMVKVRGQAILGNFTCRKVEILEKSPEKSRAARGRDMKTTIEIVKATGKHGPLSRFNDQQLANMPVR